MTLNDLKLATLDASVRAVLIVDYEGIIVWANPAMGTLTGYDPTELIGQHTRIFRSGKHDDQFYSDLWTTLACGQRWSGRLVNKRKNGDLYTEEMVVSPIKPGMDGDVHYFAVKEDVSERVAIERERQRQASEIRRLNVELAAALRAGILMVADLADRYSPNAGKHARRVADLSVMLARQLRLDRTVTDRIRYAALLHDIGKTTAVSDPDGPALAEHASAGARILAPLAKFDEMAAIVRHHHESWDGSGTPDGKAGQAIPIGSRIVAVANAFDRRLYQNGESIAAALETIRESSGSRFDPAVVDALIRELANPETAERLDAGVQIGITELQPGAVLTDDLRTESGILLYAAGTLINRRCLDRLHGVSGLDPLQDRVMIRRSTGPTRLPTQIASA